MAMGSTGLPRVQPRLRHAAGMEADVAAAAAAVDEDSALGAEGVHRCVHVLASQPVTQDVKTAS